MKTIKLILIGLVACIALQAQNTMDYKGLTVDFDQLTENLNGTGQLLDSAQKYEGVAGAKYDFINMLEALNPDLVTENYEQAKRMLLVSSSNVEKEMLARLAVQYMIDNNVWNPAGLIGQEVEAKTVNGNWKQGIYQGEVNGLHVIQATGRDELGWFIDEKTIIIR
jgi:hypothetical protein